MSTVVAGVDIGGTTTQVVLSDESLTVLGRADVTTPAKLGGVAMVAAAVSLIEDLLASTGHTLSAVAVGAAGVVDSNTGTVVVASDSFTGWTGFGVTDAFTAALGVPSYLDNDVNAFLRGEAAAGSLRGETDALGITLGTGVGGALWLHGDLHHGQHGAAGHRSRGCAVHVWGSRTPRNPRLRAVDCPSVHDGNRARCPGCAGCSARRRPR